MPCILWLESALPSANLLENITLTPCKVIEKGSVVATQAGTRSYEQTLIGFDISKADFTEIKKQIEDAVLFFEANEKHLDAIFSKDILQVFLGFMSFQILIAIFTTGRCLDFSYWISYFVLIRFFENDFSIFKFKTS